MNILKKIFTEHYEEIKYILHPRPIVMENIEKMVNCGDPSFGGAMYGCPSCGELKLVPFRRHSKFCPTCGNKYSIDRSTNISFKLIHCTHRPLEWNPHIHCLLTEGGFSDDGFWKVVKYFNYTYLRKAFQTALLNEVQSRIGDSFKKTKSLIYEKKQERPLCLCQT